MNQLSKSDYLKVTFNDLLDLIERANNAIIRHKQQGNPDEIAIEGFERLRQQHIDKLNELMAEFDLSVNPHIKVA